MIMLAIGLLVLIVVGVGIIPRFFTGGDVVGQQLGGLDDFDNDKVANFYDNCPCTPIGIVESADLQGCPRGTTAEQSQENKKLFKDQKCPEIVPVAGESESGSTTLKVFDGNLEIFSGTKTSSASIRYEATCATKCSTKIRFPGSSDLRPLDVFDHDNLATNELRLPDAGTYFIIVEENNQQKIQFRLEKQE